MKIEIVFEKISVISILFFIIIVSGGEQMGFDYTYLQSIRRRDSSPTDSLLTEWGNKNHTVTDLFVLLSKMQNYRAMSLIKDFGK